MDIAYPDDWWIDNWYVTEFYNPSEQALFVAILNGDVSALRQILKLNKELANVTIAMADGGTTHRVEFYVPVLLVAVRRKSLPLVKVLLDSGADIHACDGREGNDALGYAINVNAGKDILNEIFHQDANPQVDDQFGSVFLAYSCRVTGWALNPNEANWLLENGVDPDWRRADGSTVWLDLERHGLGKEFLDWNWSDQPGWWMVRPLYKYSSHLPGIVQFLFLLVLTGGVAGWLYRRRARVTLPARTQRRLARWSDALKGTEGFEVTGNETMTGVTEDLVRVVQLSLRRRLWQRATWPAVLAGGVALSGILSDSMLMQLSYIDAVLGFALGYCLLYALLWLPWTLAKVAVSVALLGLSILAIPALAYQGLLMYLHLREVFVCATFELAAVLFTVQVGLFGRLIWLNVRLLKAEWRPNRELARDLRARENTGIDAPSGTWDEGKP